MLETPGPRVPARCGTIGRTEVGPVDGLAVLVAPNAFKGALDAERAAAAMAEGAREAGADRVDAAPMADGGDGTARVLAHARGGTLRHAVVPDAWGRPRRAAYAVLPDGTAVVDVAAASGLGRRRPGPAAALAASTYGTGCLIREAVRSGARRVVVALGGSATTDGGAGCLAALGAQVLDAAGASLPPGGGALPRADRVDLRGLAWLEPVRFEALVDVENPLLGPEGAAPVFGPQKGADPATVARLAEGLARWADLLEAAAGRPGRDLPGAGAAGGTGFALAVALRARLAPGAAFVAEAVGLAARLAEADLVLTGEGALDGQTARGKAPYVVARLARARGVPCVALVGTLGDGWTGCCGPDGFTACFPIGPGPRPRLQALREASADLRRTAAMAVRLFAAGRTPRP
jgi:glycerate kinase